MAKKKTGEGLDGFALLQEKIKNKAKGTHISTLSESDIAQQRQWLPTPAYDLNRVLSGSFFRGIPSRSMTLIVGPEASFKSSFMCLCAAEAQRQGYKPFIIDTEGAWTPDFVKRWGIDPDDTIYVYEPFIDKILVTLAQVIDSIRNEGLQKIALILDSVGGIEMEKLIDDGLSGDVKADQGGLARKIKRMLKMLLYICKFSDSICLISGHLVGKPNSGYGNPEDIGGGKFVKLAPDTIISLRKSKIQDKDKNVIGTQIKAIPVKNRFYPPFNEAVVEINYKDGINKFAGLIQLGLDHDLIERAGAWYSIEGERVQGTDNLAELLNNNKDLADKFLNTIEEWLKSTGYSSFNEKVKENLDDIINEASEEVSDE